MSESGRVVSKLNDAELRLLEGKVRSGNLDIVVNSLNAYTTDVELDGGVELLEKLLAARDSNKFPVPFHDSNTIDRLWSLYFCPAVISIANIPELIGCVPTGIADNMNVQVTWADGMVKKSGSPLSPRKITMQSCPHLISLITRIITDVPIVNNFPEFANSRFLLALNANCDRAIGAAGIFTVAFKSNI
jgi:hypothetical protein